MRSVYRESTEAEKRTNKTYGKKIKLKSTIILENRLDSFRVDALKQFSPTFYVKWNENISDNLNGHRGIQLGGQNQSQPATVRELEKGKSRTFHSVKCVWRPICGSAAHLARPISSAIDNQNMEPRLNEVTARRELLQFSHLTSVTLSS